MPVFTEDPTDAAVFAAVPCLTMPPSGVSNAIGELLDRPAGHGFIVGKEGMMLVLNRSWLGLRKLVTSAPECHVPYGSVGPEGVWLKCGLIPHELLDHIIAHFRTALPNEAAAFILWDESTRAFSVVFPEVHKATPSVLIYHPPHAAPGMHVICDLHSHGAGEAFFSVTDNADDAHATKIAVVIGRLDTHEPTFFARLCAAGMFIAMRNWPFAPAGFVPATEETSDAA